MFIAYEVARELIESLRPILEAVHRRDKDLASQMRRAGSSVLLNIAEGNRRVGLDRLHFFRIAAGSAAEVRAALDAAAAWGFVERDSMESLNALIDRELGLLWGLTHSRR